MKQIRKNRIRTISRLRMVRINSENKNKVKISSKHYELELI